MKFIDLGGKEKLSADTSFLHVEYTALRGEILKRMDVENQLMTFTVIMFGTLLGAGFQNRTPFLILLYPTLSVFFSIGWAHSDYMVRLIGKPTFRSFKKAKKSFVVGSAKQAEDLVMRGRQR